MKKTCTVLFIALSHLGEAFSISSQDTNKIKDKIWKNECNGTIEGLTNWKKGENFASVGIGHFIWYSTGNRERFQETFPEVLAFIESKGGTLPLWLKNSNVCPWNSRDEFYQKIDSPEMKSLRQFLFETRDLQAMYIVDRLEKTFPLMIEKLSDEQKEKVTKTFERLSKEPSSLFAMIDYLHFKGAGTAPAEVYQGQGWGLLQVLLRLDPSSPQPLVDFVHSAKEVLSQRIQNSPPERNEAQWKQGWFNRLDTYLKS